MVSRKGFVEALRLLLDEGFRFTVIGGSVVEIALGSRDLGADIDVFSEHPSVFDEQAFFELASSRNLVLGQTWLGTPRLIIRTASEEVPVEFYENLFDFYIPEEMIEESQRVSLDSLRIKAISVEDHIVLKANAGRSMDLDRLSEISRLIKRGRLEVRRDMIIKRAKLFDDEKTIIRRLRDSGIL
ncbi:MAG: nucleotidyltransferase [Desulfurococcales archaeon]|nr:nucleotidyltransferase [Desulfurococcales archaeon]